MGLEQPTYLSLRHRLPECDSWVDTMERPWKGERAQTRTTKAGAKMLEHAVLLQGCSVLAPLFQEQAEVQEVVLQEFADFEQEFGLENAHERPCPALVVSPLSMLCFCSAIAMFYDQHESYLMTGLQSLGSHASPSYLAARAKLIRRPRLLLCRQRVLVPRRQPAVARVLDCPRIGPYREAR